MKQTTTILVVDDHPIVRAGCRQLIMQIPSVKIIEAETGEEGYRLFQESVPDIDVMGINRASIVATPNDFFHLVLCITFPFYFAIFFSFKNELKATS